MIRSLTSRFLGLPRQGYRWSLEREWVELSDGARLATTLFRPRDLPAPRAAAVLVRTPFGLRSPLEPAALLGRGLAAAGFHVVVQDVRGRFESEGRFDPFLHEASDGEETIRWIEEQPWYDGRLGLAGFSYAGWSALAALGAAPKRVAALAVAGVGSDLRAALRPGGAFSLDLGLRLALALAEREPPRRVDLGRAFPYRPLGEADRVAWRQTPGFRRWLAPAAPYWSEILPVLPEAAPPTLLVGGLYDPFLPALLSDHAALAGSATRLIIGPWLHPRPVRFTRRRGAPHRAALWEIVNFLQQQLGDGEASTDRVYVQCDEAGPGRTLTSWPPPEANRRRFHLRSNGHANGAAGDGRLDEAPPPAGEAADRFTYDPSSPCPSLGGSLVHRGGPADQRAVEARSDVLCYSSDPLGADLVAMGTARVVLFAASSAPDTDFTAKLLDVHPGGASRWVAEGIIRCRHRKSGDEPTWLTPGEPVRLEIELDAACHTFRSGHRIRLHVSSSSFPRYDRNPNTKIDPAIATPETSATARQTLLHEAEHPSSLELHVLEG